MRLWYSLIILHARIQEILSGERGGPGPTATSLFSPQLNLQKSNGFFSKKNIMFQDSRGVQHFRGVVQLFGGGGGGGVQLLIPYKNPNNLCFSRGVGPPVPPSGSSHENSLFRCFVHGLKMCMSCALDRVVKLFSLSLFYELVIQFQVDICILDTILMLANLGPVIWSRVWGVSNCWGVCPDCYNDTTSFTF